MTISRRNFLKVSGLAAIGIAAGSLDIGTRARAAAKGTTNLRDKVMLNDSSKCIGCLSCAIACKKTNGLLDTFSYSPSTSGDTWTTVKLNREAPKDKENSINLKVQCMHCNQPSCVAVCPTGATYKREDGIVAVDQDTCIGCRYCAIACPFSVPGVSEKTGTARKCTFCESRLTESNEPVCAEACPMDAIEFGGIDDMLSKARARVKHLKSNGFPNANLYGHRELGGLKVLYVLPDSPATSGLPENPRLSTGDSLVKWMTGLSMAGYLVFVPLRKLFLEGLAKDDQTNDQKEVKKDVR